MRSADAVVERIQCGERKTREGALKQRVRVRHVAHPDSGLKHVEDAR